MEDSCPITVDQVADLAGLRRGRPVPGKGFCVECPFCGGEISRGCWALLKPVPSAGTP